MKNSSDKFPAGVAQGAAFINRIEERKQLKERLYASQHTVLMGPRRYGKTSLMEKVVDETHMSYCSLDLLAAYNVEYVRDQILDKVSKLVFQLLPVPKKATEIILKIFRSMQPEISVGALGQHLRLKVSDSPAQDITDLLLRLDEVAKQANKKAVIFMDEFQQISRLQNYHSIEASIRHAVERSKHIAYVFSGSNRQLLIQIFGDQGRPLYRLCHLMTIERMQEAVYCMHLQSLGKEKWNKPLSAALFSRIMELTERHPFYVNMVCQIIWRREKYPTLDEVEMDWDNYVQTQRHIISHDIMELSTNQRRVMTLLSQKPTKELFSAEFVGLLKLSTSSVQQAVEVLLKKDMIFLTDNGLYSVLDPAVSYYLSKIVWR